MAKTPLIWDGTDAQGQPLRWNTPGLTWGGFLPQPTKRMPQLRVLLGFANASDPSLGERGQAVHDSLYSSPLWAVPPNPAPPVAQAALATAVDDFNEAIAAAALGGPEETAAKNNDRQIVSDLLRQLAGYVQENHGNDLEKLLASGFEAVSTNRASKPLDRPTIKDIINGMSTQLIVRVTRIDNAKAYEVRYALLGPGGAPGPWLANLLFTSSRGMNVGGLTPGGNYVMQVRAVGGSTGYSDWSDAVSHMSM